MRNFFQSSTATDGRKFSGVCTKTIDGRTTVEVGAKPDESSTLDLGASTQTLINAAQNDSGRNDRNSTTSTATCDATQATGFNRYVGQFRRATIKKSRLD